MLVNSIEAEYHGAGKSCSNIAEHNTLMRYLMSVLLFSQFQQPSVFCNMTVTEVIKARRASDGRWVILVSDHKTGVQGPAQIALEHQYYKLFDLYDNSSVSAHYCRRHRNFARSSSQK